MQQPSAASRTRCLLWDSCWGTAKEGLEGGGMLLLDVLGGVVDWLQADHLRLKENAKLGVVYL